MTDLQRKAYASFLKAGRELFHVMNVTENDKRTAIIEFDGEDIADWVDDDIFIAYYMALKADDKAETEELMKLKNQ